MMFSRALIGILIGLVSGACIGAAWFAASESLFGRGIGLLGPSPRLAAIVGAVSVGTLGVVVGAVVASVNLGKVRGLWVGAAAGLVMAALSLWRGGH